MKEKKLLLIELNEINFDIVQKYIDDGEELKSFKYLSNKIINTNSENEYENLEPWIQWPSVHTGKSFKQHEIFRLGDIVNSSENQFFEKVENAGYSVGAISPMNASNKMKNPLYFIPDPWTATEPDRSFLNKILSKSISQAVNDNSKSKLSASSLIGLLVSFLYYVPTKKYLSFIRYATSSIGKKWRRALFLDMFLYEVHKSLFKKKNPNFSTLFLNAGAHIQHHYFLNSRHVETTDYENPNWYIKKENDPILEMLKVYDDILSDILRIKNTQIIIATGLSQKPFKKPIFYYRLRDHERFLKMLGIKSESVEKRMTRDFLINFGDIGSAKTAQRILESVFVNNKRKLFGEIDNRGKSLFVVLTYSFNIDNNAKININNKQHSLKKYVSFVAIKNGDHQQKGFLYLSDDLNKFKSIDNKHVSAIHDVVLGYFGVS